MKIVMKDIFLMFMFQNQKYWMNFIMVYRFLPERIKIEKIEKLATNFHEKKEFVIHIRYLKQALNQRLVLKKAHRVIKLSLEALLKVHLDINIQLKNQMQKNYFKKYFFQLMNNKVFRKTMENVRKIREIKLGTTEARRTYLVSEPNYRTKSSFWIIYQQQK